MRPLALIAALALLTGCAQQPTLEDAIGRCAAQSVADYLEQYPDDDTSASVLLEVATDICTRESTEPDFLETWSS